MAAYKILQSSSSYPLVFLLILTSDHISPATTKTPTVTISKNGGAFSSPSGAVTEIANGWYKVVGNATDSNTLGSLILHATEASSDPTDMLFEVVSYNPQSSTNLGLSALPTANPGANNGLGTCDANNRLKVLSGLTTNTAISNFEFLMVLSSDHYSVGTGLTITAQTSIDNAAFISCTNSPVEVANGIYYINLTAADLNGIYITLKFSAATADTRFISLVLTP